MTAIDCMLCATPGATRWQSVDSRHYHHCEACGLVFLDPAQRLSPEAERRHYLTHDNRIDDAGYRRFLSRLADPLLARLDAPAQCLDFGCGPVPAMATLFAAAGHRMASHDPWFHDRPEALTRQYDVITLSEVIEHLHQPLPTLRHVASLLRPGGWLGLMTEFLPAAERFARWRYRRDPTHVAFYGPKSMAWLAAALGLRLELAEGGVVLLQAPPAPQDNVQHAAT